METKEKIIEVAGEQFMRYGVRSVTMDDIARQAGISKKTIYQEFSDKNQLVYDTFATAIQNDKCMMDRFPQIKDGVIEHLIGLSDYIRARFADFNPLVLNEIQRYFPQCWQLFEEFRMDHIKNHIQEVLQQGIKQGFFRPEIDTEVIALMRIEQMMATFDPIKFPPSKFNIIDLQLQIFEHFLYGIFTEKGKEAYLSKKTKTNENHN